eukprot:TRINITY_DN31763_c0_g1_i1.p2 TRINITY_DN31763_c0_g1~~TRINITY_DN31763_c0_g1_i1.p2  ORF type:complete len:106 (+),score=23.24 TRINITY_DN31763_c0_g1_i1:176-493(+)
MESLYAGNKDARAREKAKAKAKEDSWRLKPEEKVSFHAQNAKTSLKNFVALPLNLFNLDVLPMESLYAGNKDAREREKAKARVKEDSLRLKPEGKASFHAQSAKT